MYDVLLTEAAAPPETEPDRQQYFIDKARQMLSQRARDCGRPLTYCVKTFGCQMNARDSEKLTGILEEIGYIASESEDADFVIYNTCTVRENANNKVYGHLGYLHGYKKKNPEMRIALCGCMMQEEVVLEKIRSSYKFVDLVFGTHNIYKFAELYTQMLEEDRQVIDIWKDAGPVVESLPNKRKYAFKTGVNIMFGCNNFCSYCIVPYVRGRERSRRPEDIIEEIKGFVADGVIEVMLLGQNVNSYGNDFALKKEGGLDRPSQYADSGTEQAADAASDQDKDPETVNPDLEITNADPEPVTFAQLLQQIEQIEGLERIRFMTSHPKDLSDELIEVMKNSKKICRHLHLPLQSGSTRILQAMNRRYTKESYLELANKIRAAMPDIALTTDIIVGFPGETDEDFADTMDVVRQVRFDSAFTFIYSKRTGTPAAAMENQVPPDEVNAHFAELLKEVQAIGAERSLTFEGTVQKVLVEDVNRQDPALVTGRMENNSVVHFPGTADLIGRICTVYLKECKGFYYIGELTGYE